MSLEVLLMVVMVQLWDISAVWASNYHLTLRNITEDLAIYLNRYENLKRHSSYFPKQPEGVCAVKPVVNGNCA
jgi:hypothetical protein